MKCHSEQKKKQKQQENRNNKKETKKNWRKIFIGHDDVELMEKLNTYFMVVNSIWKLAENVGNKNENNFGVCKSFGQSKNTSQIELKRVNGRREKRQEKERKEEKEWENKTNRWVEHFSMLVGFSFSHSVK